jgi:hypothetical protein
MLAEADAMARAAAREEEVIALGNDLEPCAKDVAPSEGATDGEAEIFGGDLGGSSEEGDWTWGLAEGGVASAGDGEGSPAGEDEAGGGESGCEVGKGDVGGPGADAVGGAVWVGAGDEPGDGMS